MHALLFTGAAIVLVVWVLEWRAGVINPWDRWLLPLMAMVIGGSGLLMLRRSTHEHNLPAVPVMAFNAYLVVTLHMVLLFTDGGTQWYQGMTTLYWVPLGYGCAFVFLSLRPALVVSGATAVGLFAPLLLWWHLGWLPAWATDAGPLLPLLAMAQVMYVMLLAAVVRLRRSQEQAQSRAELMRTLASTDVLTGLPNRRAMLDVLQRTVALSQRSGRPVSVALVDVDHFKSVNDRFGHASGDAVLVQLGELMRTQLRASDVLARWGGEEFLLCAPDTSVSAAADLADRVRQAVAGWTFPHGEPMTISIGLTQWLGGDDVDGLLLRADRALYQAKARGRNRVETQVVEAAG
jgi:diguanylate cyclase (GGDEF)-like protein